MADPAPSPAPKRKLSNLLLVWGFTRRYPLQLAIATASLVASSVATLWIPRTFKQIVDNGFAAGADTSRIGVYFQGLLLVVLALAVAGLVFGSEYNVLQRLDLPRIPIDEGTATTGGIIALVAVLLVTLLGAILGGKLGDRFHRKVDRAGFDATV